MLQIYNTLTKQKEIFKPLKSPQVGLYVCGVTVYDYCHVGHARTYLLFDMIQRYLTFCGYDVKYIRNITDIDDKIIKRALENNESCQNLTERFIKAMHEDLHDTLKTLSPREEPKATEYLTEMIQLIEQLIAKGYAYVAENNDVYFEVKKFKSYGSLANRALDDLLAGARIEVNEAKQNPLDFVLWKAAKPNEPFWPSPWGNGRPGWHTECSAMSLKILGNTFDIHGGGPDLKFPHHENERAQSEALTQETFVNYWMHVGYLQIDKEKMSKSAGNFITIREFLKQYHPEVLRYFNIASHYRSPVEYSNEAMDLGASALERFYIALRGLKNAKPPMNTEFEARFIEAMNDDFNTPIALSVLFDLVRAINSARETNLAEAESLGALLRKLAQVLGLLNEDAESFLQNKNMLTQDETLKIERLIKARNEARLNKNWAEADRVRDELTALGVELEDKQTETLWRIKEKTQP